MVLRGLATSILAAFLTLPPASPLIVSKTISILQTTPKPLGRAHALRMDESDDLKARLSKQMNDDSFSISSAAKDLQSADALPGWAFGVGAVAFLGLLVVLGTLIFS